MNKLVCILSVHLFLSFCSHANAQSIDPVLAQRLQTKLDSLKTAYNIKGISASVLYPARGLWKGTTGESYGSLPIQAEMEFGIGSNTKLFTAVVLLKLAEDNILSVDDSLHKWLPTIANADSTITIRQLLNHTSGLADYNEIAGYADSILTNPNRLFTPRELVTWIRQPLFSAGTSWSYSNTNYLLAAMIAENATSKSIARLLRDRVLSPLQLDSTFFDVQESVQGTIAHPWQMGVDINSIPRSSLNSAAYSAGAMYSTSSEMAQWYQKLMSDKVLTPNSFKQMTTFVGSGNYGFGISRIEIGPRVCFAHGGSIRGYTSYMMYDSSSNAIVCVLMNANPAPARLVGEQLLLTLINFATSLPESSTNDDLFEVYPSPTSSALFLQTACTQSHHYHIVNCLGQVLQQGDTDTKSIDVSHLPQGTYVLCIRNNEHELMHYTFVKQ